MNCSCHHVFSPPWSSQMNLIMNLRKKTGSFCEGKIPKTPTTVCLHLSGSHLYYTCLALKKATLQKIFGAFAIFIIGLKLLSQTGYYRQYLLMAPSSCPARATSPNRTSIYKAPSVHTSYVSGLAGAVFAHFPLGLLAK